MTDQAEDVRALVETYASDSSDLANALATGDANSARYLKPAVAESRAAVESAIRALQQERDALKAELDARRKSGTASDRLHNICQAIGDEREIADAYTVKALELADAANVELQQKVRVAEQERDALRAALTEARHALCNAMACGFDDQPPGVGFTPSKQERRASEATVKCSAAVKAIDAALADKGAAE